MIANRFTTSLMPKAVHIDYLRLRCGEEETFLKKMKSAISFIAFSEWDVVLFIPCSTLYDENLLAIYEDPSIVTAIAGSAGYFNYVWNHPINTDWEGRLANVANLSSPNSSDVSMLVSLRFTDAFRSRWGLGAELLFCNFLAGLRVNGLDLFAVHSVGWNDVTVMMWTRRGQEHRLLDALTAVRYCSVAKCVGNQDPARVVAASYSHFLGNLTKYVDTELDFGGLGDRVKQARLLVRTTPAMEPSIRTAYGNVAAQVRKDLGLKALPKRVRGRSELGTELGHYNFSADILWTFKAEDGRAPVKVIQGLRREIGKELEKIKRPFSSFPETTTEIRFEENDVRDESVAERPPIRVIQNYRKMIDGLMERLPGMLKGRATRMTRHRVAILLGNISAYLADPVRGSVVGHLCRFLKSTFWTVFERMEPDQQEDLCHVLEYALNQATDGLSQFQHDANSLGLSGRGGYVRVIQAMEQWMADLLESLKLNLMPLITFGLLGPATTEVRYRIDLPFNTAFAPARWPVLFHEVGHMCWHDLFGWRLESLDVWNAFAKSVEPFMYEQAEGKWVFHMNARSDVAEIFPSYVMLNIAAAGDVRLLDRMMLYGEVQAVPRRSIAPSLRRRIVLHVLLALHQNRRPSTPEGVLQALEQVDEVSNDNVELIANLKTVAAQWWEAWPVLKAEDERITLLVESATNAFAKSMSAIDKDGIREPRPSDAYGRTTELIPTSVVFKKQIAKSVQMCLDLMSVLASDQTNRVSAEVDRARAGFGEVLARIDLARLRSIEGYDKWRHVFPQALNEHVVFSEIPPATILARLLMDLEFSDMRRELLPSLTVILSLWHRGVTTLMLEESETLAKDLEELGLTCGVQSAPS